MCGIVGAVAHRNVTPVLVEGLKRLEYRGYDSAGLAALDHENRLMRVRRPGKIRVLEEALAESAVGGKVGIAHTRWATHGVPSERNAHPHVARGQIAVVHNGIVENHEDLRSDLRSREYVFESETDTEVIGHLVHTFLDQGLSLLQAVQHTTQELAGTYAIGVIATNEPRRMIAARHGSPLVIGLGESENFIASDVFALVSETQRFIFLEDGDTAELTTDQVRIYDRSGTLVERPVHQTKLAADAVERGGFRHYMQKEIHEQPSAIEKTLDGRSADGRVLDAAFGPDAGRVFDRVRGVQIVACGTSYHAGNTGSESIFDSCDVDAAPLGGCSNAGAPEDVLHLS